MRITGLPHLTRETSRRHDRLFILLLLIHMMGYVIIPHRWILRRRLGVGDAAAFNLQLARLALFLRRQHPARSDHGVVARAVVVNIGL